MFHLNAFDLQIMGHVVTFDIVTAYGGLCGLVFLTGFIVASQMERRRNALRAPRVSRG